MLLETRTVAPHLGAWTSAACGVPRSAAAPETTPSLDSYVSGLYLLAAKVRMGLLWGKSLELALANLHALPDEEVYALWAGPTAADNRNKLLAALSELAQVAPTARQGHRDAFGYWPTVLEGVLHLRIAEGLVRGDRVACSRAAAELVTGFPDATLAPLAKSLMTGAYWRYDRKR